MKVILDVDTGVDDALAILLACHTPGLDVRAITCVAGNADVDQVVVNTLAVLEVAGGPDIPVARGMSRPLAGRPHPPRRVHGEDGMGDLKLPAPRRSVAGVPAAELLQSTLAEATEPVTLVCLAPLTNIAHLVRRYPQLLERLERIVLMGGAASVDEPIARSEFNVRSDPEAAAIVLGCGASVTMYGLDVSYLPTIEVRQADALVAARDPAQQLAGRLLQFQLERFGGRAAPLGDAGAMAAALRPDLIETCPSQVRVELADPRTRGRTIVDQPLRSLGEGQDQPGPGRLIDVAVAGSGRRLAEVFMDALLGS